MKIVMNKLLFFVLLGLPVLLNAMQGDVEISQKQLEQFKQEDRFSQAMHEYGKQLSAGFAMGLGIETYFACNSGGFREERLRTERQPTRSIVFGLVPVVPVLYFSTEKERSAEHWYASAGMSWAGYCLAILFVNTVKAGC